MKEFIYNTMMKFGMTGKKKTIISCVASGLISFVLYFLTIGILDGFLMIPGAIITAGFSYWVENHVVPREEMNRNLPTAVVLSYILVLLVLAIINPLHMTF